MSDDLSGFSLMDLFRSEAEGQTATLSSGLLALERDEGGTPAMVESMMRAAHSLKGAARTRVTAARRAGAGSAPSASGSQDFDSAGGQGPRPEADRTNPPECHSGVPAVPRRPGR